MQESPIRYRRKQDSLDVTEGLRQWIRRESQKDEYPDANPSGWDEERLVSELETTYDEPVQYATFGAPEWTTLVVSGSELGKFDPYPSIGCNWLTGGETLAGAIDRLQAGELDDECPEFVEEISTFRGQYPDHEFGAVVVRQCEEYWPPVTLDGNHRGWAAILAARDGVGAELDVHVAHETPLDDLPFEKATTA
ncbi:hypothetical protein M0R88_04565 [Halorussus gelatinilyticus]|uniref:Uncharacterized protein n=1 Tax=Halorussus gelatinilyticus TaxID=2937524 RepID=A0A8U0IKU2_9EURY|nr:hypothetical protein [Halorussus gelatinilyticus]UPW01378.1 hypothetical protein M0R88_04565 [Halorussus gelatinilyticus]